MAGSPNGELTRRERERLMHRQQMLEAAERVFVRDGYQGATIERTAQEADFAVGTLYNFFESKEKLFGEVMRRIVNEALEQVEARVFSEADPKKALEELIRIRIMYPLEHRGFARVFMDVAPGSSLDLASGLPPECRALYEGYLSSVAELIRRGIRSGVFRKAEPLYVALCLEGAFRAIGMHWTLNESGEPSPGTVDEVVGILMGMVCRPQAPFEEGCTG